MKFIQYFPQSLACHQSAQLPGGLPLVHWGPGGLALAHWSPLGRPVVSAEVLLHAMVRFNSSNSPQQNQTSNRQSHHATSCVASGHSLQDHVHIGFDTLGE